MVATDIAARGIDIDDISHVVNFDVPTTPDAYIHRIGRTARAEATGDAFTLVDREEEPLVKDIEKALTLTLPRVTLPEFAYRKVVDGPHPARPRPGHGPHGPRGHGGGHAGHGGHSGGYGGGHVGGGARP